METRLSFKAARCIVSLFTLFSIGIFSIKAEAQNWIPKGMPVNGDSVLAYAGNSTDISGKGDILIVGMYGSDASGYDKGTVQVLKWQDTAWVQLGQTIAGDNDYDRCGFAVSISDDGQVIAIASTGNDSAATNAGMVRMYSWDGASWVKKGSDIFGVANNDAFGQSVSLNHDGTIVAAGAPDNDGGAFRAGHTRVFYWTGNDWNQLGNDIEGEAMENYSGFALSLSEQDTVIAIGAYYNGGAALQAGHIRVYDWIDTLWVQRGMDIDGLNAYDQFGYSVDITPDGNTLISGAVKFDGTYVNTGAARVFDWSGTAWQQRGGNLEGTWSDDAFGSSVSINSDGNTVAVGAKTGHSSIFANPEQGYTRIFNWDTSWTQVGNTIYGAAHGDRSGQDVALNARGKMIAIGEPYADPNGMGAAGKVRVFFTCDTTYSNFSETACFAFDLPSGKGAVTTSGTYVDTILNIDGCDSIMTINVTVNTVDTVVSKNGVTLSAQATSATYQWLDCNSGFSVINGETNQSFTPTLNGNYAVEITENGCVDTSNCFTISTIGLPESTSQSFKVYPNPTAGEVHITFERSQSGVQVNIYNLLGQKLVQSVLAHGNHSMVQIPGQPGIYLLEVIFSSGDKRLVKVRKQ